MIIMLTQNTLAAIGIVNRICGHFMASCFPILFRHYGFIVQARLVRVVDSAPSVSTRNCRISPFFRTLRVFLYHYDTSPVLVNPFILPTFLKTARSRTISSSP